MKKLTSLFLGLIFAVSSFATCNPIFPNAGGSGVCNNNANTVTLGGPISTQGILSVLGAYSLTATLSANSSVTFPTSGNLLTDTGSYPDPTWLTSLAGSKLTGTVTANAIAAGTYGVSITGNSASSTSIATTATTTDSYFYPLFVASSVNGNQLVNLGTGLTFNPSNNNLTTAIFTGALQGNATTVTNGVYTTDTGTVTNTMLAGSIAASKLVGSDIATLGTITSGTWNGTAINAPYINFNATNLKNSTNALNTIQDIATTSSPVFTGVTANTLVSNTGNGLTISTPIPAAGVNATTLSITSANGTVGGSNSSNGSPINITSGNGAGSGGADAGAIAITGGNSAASSGSGGAVTITAGKGRAQGADVTISGAQPQITNSNAGNVNVNGGVGLGAGTGGNVNISAGNSGTTGVGGNVVLTAGTATSGTPGAVQVATGNLQVSSLTASELTATDASKNLISGNLSGDVITSGLVATLPTVNSNVGSFGSATQVGTFTVNDKGLITAAGNTTISGVAPGGSASGDLSGTYPSPTVLKINGATLGTMTATSGNIPVGSGTQWVTQAVSGDGTLSSTGALTITKTNGASFVASATTNTTNAGNISSGILPSGRISGSYTGITAVGTLPSLTISSAAANTLLNISNTLAGSSNSSGVAISRADIANGFANTYWKTGSTFYYELGMQPGDSHLYLVDVQNSSTNIFDYTPGTGTSGILTFASTLDSSGNIKIITSGKTLYIKQGANGCAGSATLSGATTTVSTTCAAAGDLIFFGGRTTMGSAPGFLSYAISDGVSFTITSSTGASDDGVVPWFIIKAS